MSKFIVGVPLWNCLDMVPWILEGCAKLDPSRVDLAFLFSNTPTEVRENFEKSKGMLRGFGVVEMHTDQDLREGDNHNALMEYFMQTKADYLLCPQDDNQFQDVGILDDIEAVYAQYGDRVGIIGCRDGYGQNWSNMVSSPWSHGDIARRHLKVGEFAESLICNTGPFVYSRHTIERCGFNDHWMPFFSFEDYCLRCCHNGKVNITLGTDMKHEKFGRLREMDNGGPAVAADLRRLQGRWGPVHG